jgi:hypothetical protein
MRIVDIHTDLGDLSFSFRSGVMDDFNNSKLWVMRSYQDIEKTAVGDPGGINYIEAIWHWDYNIYYGDGPDDENFVGIYCPHKQIIDRPVEQAWIDKYQEYVDGLIVLMALSSGEKVNYIVSERIQR